MVLFTNGQNTKYGNIITKIAVRPQKIIKPLHCNEMHSKFVTINVKTTVGIDIR